MINVKKIRETPDIVREGLSARGRDAGLVDIFLAKDAAWRAAATTQDVVRAELNALSKARDIEGAKVKKVAAKEAEAALAALAAERDALLEQFPNTPDASAPRGRGEHENVVVREVGEKQKFDFVPKDYLTIAEGMGVIDVKKAAEVSGSRFGYLRGDAALLELALVRYAMGILARKGFVPVIPPVMIKPAPYAGMGRLPAHEKDERYYLPADDLYLVGSAEHTMGPIHMGETLNDKDLPKRYAGFSTCFRRESGSYGKDTKGILRVHQFDKVEMFSFSAPGKSAEEHAFLLSCQEELLSGLGLPYRVVEICTGDMGWTDAKAYDCETWLPGQNGGNGEYRETNSCSNTTDFQARGIDCRYGGKGDEHYVHMLNATGLALGRIIIAIIENYQQADGTFAWPNALERF